MNIKDLLPIGTVVLLKNGEKRLMIAGIKQMDTEDATKEYDYYGVMYPEGHVGENFQYLFNHEDIAEIYFKGFEDEERERFLDQLAKIYR